MRRHAGQVACPGGIYEESDGDLLRTALRETEEEIGVAASAITIVCRIPEVYTVASNFLITPFVGVIRPPLELRVDPSEIEDVYEIPLRALRAQGAVHFGEEKVGEVHVPSWLFDYNGVHVWGATGRILHDLLDVLAQREGEHELEQAISLSLYGVE